MINNTFFGLPETRACRVLEPLFYVGSPTISGLSEPTPVGELSLPEAMAESAEGVRLRAAGCEGRHSEWLEQKVTRNRAG